MAEPRTTADEAADPSTSAERLLELAEKHPQLHRLLVMNPSTPDVARDWILATNRWAKQAYDAAAEQPTAGFDPVPDEGPAQPEEPEEVSAWGDFGDEDVWGPSTGGIPAADEPATAESAPVRIPEGAGVVPLGPADGPTQPAEPTSGPPTAALPVTAAASVPAAPPAEDEDSGSRYRTWIACGGCLLLALLLLLVAVLAGRALLAPDEEAYQRDSSTTAAQSPSEEPSAEETTEEVTPSPEPVSPAPEGAKELTQLRSPTGNISCILEKDSVSCSVIDRRYEEAGLEDCDNGPFSITVADGEARRACGSSYLTDAAALEYDDSATYGNMACTSRFNGMTCWNTLTGKGFFVNRVKYETF